MRRGRSLSQADGALKKPFEASALLAAVKPLAEAAARGSAAGRRRPGGGRRSGAGGQGSRRARSSPWWMRNRCARP